jgi:23S rRNA pseudouridine2605 synthase
MKKRKNKRDNKNRDYKGSRPWDKRPSSKSQAKKQAPAAKLPEDCMALNKYLAQSGLCSRRKAVELIAAGEVEVNGEVVTVPYLRVMPGDKVAYKGEIQRIENQKVYVLLNKPKNCITSTNDPEGRMTVMDLVAGAADERLFPVGRLDRNTTGLLLLTNDGDLAKKLSHPSHKVKKVYYATLDQALTREDLGKIQEGLELEDGTVEVDAIGYVEGSKKHEIGLEIHLGRNRIVRRIFEHLGYQVTKLDRMYYAGLTKKDIPRGKWRHLTPKEVIMLKHFT